MSPLSNQDKLGLLVDLLNSQATNQLGTTNQMNQLLDLLTSLLEDTSLPNSTNDTLLTIQSHLSNEQLGIQSSDVEQWTNRLDI